MSVKPNAHGTRAEVDAYIASIRPGDTFTISKEMRVGPATLEIEYMALENGNLKATRLREVYKNVRVTGDWEPLEGRPEVRLVAEYAMHTQRGEMYNAAIKPI